MKRLGLLLAIGVIIFGTIIFTRPTVDEPGAQVAATTFPIYDMTRNISDGAVNVALILPVGTSTHTFDPTPKTLRNLRDTEVIFAIGHGSDDWTDKITESISAEKIVVDQNITIHNSAEIEHHDEDEHEDEDEDKDHDEEAEHAHGETDPHYWLSIPNAKIIATNISEALSKKYPEHADAFASNLNTYLEKLDDADLEIRENLRNVENKNLITLHDAWYYFAEEYDLNIVGTFEPSAGREPTPQYLVELTEAIEESGSKTLYSEPQLSTSGLESFTNDNDLTIIELDPIGGIPGRETYINLMKYNAQVISQNQ